MAGLVKVKRTIKRYSYRRKGNKIIVPAHMRTYKQIRGSKGYVDDYIKLDRLNYKTKKFNDNIDSAVEMANKYIGDKLAKEENDRLRIEKYDLENSIAEQIIAEQRVKEAEDDVMPKDKEKMKRKERKWRNDLIDFIKQDPIGFDKAYQIAVDNSRKTAGENAKNISKVLDRLNVEKAPAAIRKLNKKLGKDSTELNIDIPEQVEVDGKWAFK